MRGSLKVVRKIRGKYQLLKRECGEQLKRPTDIKNNKRGITFEKEENTSAHYYEKQ